MRKFIFSTLMLLGSLLVLQGQEESERLVYHHRFAPSEGFVNRYETQFRNEICLNGYWDFQPVELPEGWVEGKGQAPELPSPENGNWGESKIKIPSPWNVNGYGAHEPRKSIPGPDFISFPSYPDEWENIKMGWLRRTVAVPESWNGERIILHFNAVAGQTVVYVNGKQVAENFELFLPFEADITDCVKAGQEAEILVGVRAQCLFHDFSTRGRRIIPGGSMWGRYICGIWQDVYLLSRPEIQIEELYVHPMVSAGKLRFEVTLANHTDRNARLTLGGKVREWINLAGTDINSAPEPKWTLGQEALEVPHAVVRVNANSTEKTIVEIPVEEGQLRYWTPEHPELYSLVMTLNAGKNGVDTRYQRFGWREWTIEGNQHCLNGKPYQLKGDSWHFNGMHQMSRRYAWSWYKAIKDANGNAVRPHAQVYPELYMDMADEMGICVLDEAANWASDGGPKFDSEHFWTSSVEHLSKLVLRDRNHPSVFGWSISNENHPIIVNQFKNMELLERQIQEWGRWRDICYELDPSRPWVSADGEGDAEGQLPVTIGHYGNQEMREAWAAKGKPWGIGEQGMAYYGTPKEVSKYSGERAYESMLGRMEGLANECYNLLSIERKMGINYSSVFNLAWYSLRPLPIGKKDLSAVPGKDDGVFFEEFVEGIPGVQPERVGPYMSTFNPGYDPSLPLYDPWPLYDAVRAANAPDGPVWSPYAEIDKTQYEAPAATPATPYESVVYIGKADAEIKNMLDAQRVILSKGMKHSQSGLYIVDGSAEVSAKELAQLRKSVKAGADVWIAGLVPETVAFWNEFLPEKVQLSKLSRSSFLPVQRSWTRGLNNSDFYFCEVLKDYVSSYTLSGNFVESGNVLLNACRADWTMWNFQSEIHKTSALVRTEMECTVPRAVLVQYKKGSSEFYVSTMGNFTGTEVGFNTFRILLHNAGVSYEELPQTKYGMFRLNGDKLVFPQQIVKMAQEEKSMKVLRFKVFSPRDITDLLVAPDVPSLTLIFNGGNTMLSINGEKIAAKEKNVYKELPLLQGWNEFEIRYTSDSRFSGAFQCLNNKEYLPLLQMMFE